MPSKVSPWPRQNALGAAVALGNRLPLLSPINIDRMFLANEFGLRRRAGPSIGAANISGGILRNIT
jgi:hypothetical protein